MGLFCVPLEVRLAILFACACVRLPLCVGVEKA